MYSTKSCCLTIALLLSVSCSTKKDSNPLDAKNTPPLLEIIGFDADTLTFSEDQKYLFRFKATDKENNPLTVTAKPLNETGTVEMAGNDDDGVYSARYTPLQHGEHVIEVTVTDKLETVKDKVQVFFRENVPPLAKIRIATGGQVINGQTVTLDGSDSFASNGSIEQFSWFLQSPARDIQLLAVLGEARFDYLVRAEVGRNLIGLLVEDVADNISDTAWVSLAVTNQNPLAAFELQVEPFVIYVSANTSGDPDPFDRLTQQWFLDDVEQDEQHNKIQPRFSFAQEGMRSVKLRVTDGNGGVDELEKSVFVIAGPKAQLTASPTSITNTTSVLLDGSGSTGSGNTALSRYEFYRLDGNQELLLQSLASTTYRFEQILTVGPHEFGLKVIDENNVTSSMDSVTVDWLSTPPVADFANIVRLEEIKVTVNGSTDIDPGDDLSYIWLLDGVQVSTSATPTIPAVGGIHQLRLVAKDQWGESGSKQVDISVPGRPQARFVFPNNLETFESRNQQDIVLDAGFSDAGHDGGDIVVYEWRLRNNDGAEVELGVSNTAEFTFRTNYPVGVHEVGLQVTNSNRVTSDMIYNRMTIINSAPVVDFTAEPELSKISVLSNDSREIDPGDRIVTYEWFLAQDSVSALPYPVIETIEQGGNFDLLLVVTDGFGASGSKVINLDVPGKPVADFVFPGGQNSYAAKNRVSFSLDASGSDGGYLQGGVKSFTWYLKRPDASQETLATSDVSNFEFRTNHALGRYEIGLKIHNNSAMESSTVWKPLDIENSPPVAAFQAQKISCSRVYQSIEVISNSSTDIDPGDKIGDYIWFIDDQEQDDRRGVARPNMSARGDAVTVKLVVVDRQGAQGEVVVRIEDIPCKYICGSGNCQP